MNQPFTIYPAIDLRAGKVVRLQFGNPDLQTTYGENPIEFAAYWLEKGAQWLHIINLDAAFGDNDSANQKAIQTIVQMFGNQLRIQTGGGIRSLNQVRKMVDLGVARVIFGTVAVENHELVTQSVSMFGADHIVVGVDAKNGVVKTRGWVESTALSPATFTRQLKNQGIQTIIYTDINRDGTGLGINLEQTVSLAADTGLEVIASGGVNSLEDVISVKEAGLPGVVIGKALYDHRINPDHLFSIMGGKSC